MTGAVQTLFISVFKKCAKMLPTLDIFFFSYIFFHPDLYFVKRKCHGNCHEHKETIPLGLAKPINKLLA